MSNFPTNIRKPAYPLEEEIVKSQVRTEFENGVVQSRARYTTHKYRWTLNYPVMTTVDYQILRAHFYNNVGNTFNWVYPTITSHELSGSTIAVRYTEGSLKASWINKRYWSLSVQLEQK